MEQNKTSTVISLLKYTSPTSTPLIKVGKLLNHWAWEFYAYTFATLFAIFTLSCFFAFVRQSTQSSRSRNIHGRFTTVQLFIAATLKAVGMLWSPIVLHDVSMEIFTASLLIDCFSVALTLSAFSILLLILLETTKTPLGVPRLQNIWVLLAITASFTVILLTFNLLVLYANRELWFLISYLVLFIWGILICVGYTIAGYRMWRNLKSSRQLGNPTGKGRLKTIITQVFISAFISAMSLMLALFLAAGDYDLIRDNREISNEDIWSRYAIILLIRCCEFTIMGLIFGIVVRTKSRSNSVDDGQVVQLGTSTEDTTKKYEVTPTARRSIQTNPQSSYEEDEVVVHQ